MIHIANDISLRAIKPDDSVTLYNLMRKIYKPVYERLWFDDGSWYVDETYSTINIHHELSDDRSHYHFVLLKEEIVGILRVVTSEGIDGVEADFATKLHRIYLDPAILGKGIGKTLITWVEEMFCRKKGAVMWLEVMDTEVRAIEFYEKLGFKTIGTKTLTFEMMRPELRGMYVMLKRY